MNTSHVNIPVELKAKKQWVGFKVTQTKKMPVIADMPGKPASSTNPATWRSCDAAVKGLQQDHYNAIGYALNGDIIGVDLDECIVDCKLMPEAQEIVTMLASYTEYSISGKGVHILLAGSLPDNCRNRFNRNGAEVEVYDRKRFFIVTGNHVDGAPSDIRENPAAITFLLGETVAETSEAISLPSLPLSAISATLSPDDVIQKTLPKRPGERNQKLWDLARGLRFNAGMADRSLYDELKPLVRQWHRAAVSAIATKPFHDTWTDFAHAWSRVRLPLGDDVISRAWNQAQTAPAPIEAGEYDDHPQVHRLVCLCSALASHSPDGFFFLSSHVAGRLLGVQSMKVCRWFKMLAADEMLKIVTTGNEYHATRFQWKARSHRHDTHHTPSTEAHGRSNRYPSRDQHTE